MLLSTTARQALAPKSSMGTFSPSGNSLWTTYRGMASSPFGLVHDLGVDQDRDEHPAGNRATYLICAAGIPRLSGIKISEAIEPAASPETHCYLRRVKRLRTNPVPGRRIE